MTATLETIERWRAAPADFETFVQIVQAVSPTGEDVQVVCTDVRDDDGALVIEVEVRLPVQKPAQHQITGFHADVTGC